MQVNLTWDLFVIVFFVIILSYSFVIGKSGTVKLLLSSYVALLSADAIGNLLNFYFLDADPIIKVFEISAQSPILIVLKITMFIFFMVLLAVKGSFDVTMRRDNIAMEFLLTLIFGALSAIFVISGVLVFTSGASLIAGGVPVTDSMIAEMYDQSYIVKLIVLNYNFWFSLPIFAFLTVSFFHEKE